MLFKSIYVSALISSFVINNVAALQSIDHLPSCVQGVLGSLGLPTNCFDVETALGEVVKTCTSEEIDLFQNDNLIVAFSNCLCLEEGSKEDYCAIDACADTLCQPSFLCTDAALEEFKNPTKFRKLIADDYCECAVDVCIADDGGSGKSCADWSGGCSAATIPPRHWEKRPDWDTYECEGECDYDQCCYTICDDNDEYTGTCGDLSLTNGPCFGGVCTQEECCAKLCGDGAEGDWKCDAGDRFPPNQDCFKTGADDWECSKDACCRPRETCDAVCDDFDALCEDKVTAYLVSQVLYYNPCGDPDDEGGLKVDDAQCIALIKYVLTNHPECSACAHCQVCAFGMDIDECTTYEKAGESCIESGKECFGEYECTDTDAGMVRRKLFFDGSKAEKNRDPMGRGFICTKE